MVSEAKFSSGTKYIRLTNPVSYLEEEAIQPFCKKLFNKYQELLNGKEFCFSPIGLNSTFLVVPQSEFLRESIRGFNVVQPETRFHFQSANQIARFSEHSSLYLLLHVHKHGRRTVRKLLSCLKAI